MDSQRGLAYGTANGIGQTGARRGRSWEWIVGSIPGQEDVGRRTGRIVPRGAQRRRGAISAGSMGAMVVQDATSDGGWRLLGQMNWLVLAVWATGAAPMGKGREARWAAAARRELCAMRASPAEDEDEYEERACRIRAIHLRRRLPRSLAV